MDTRSKHPVAIVAITAVATISILGLLLALGIWYTKSPSAVPALGGLLASSSEIHPVEATAELCTDAGCVEGWKTDYGNYLRFRDGRAEYFALILGDKGRRYNMLVLDMRSVNLSFDELRNAVDILYYDSDYH